MARIHFLALLLAAFISLVAGSSAPTFCKCTCFKNSTIIPLGPEHQSERSLPFRDAIAIETPPTDTPELAPRSASTSCSECTKAFCLQQGIPFCKDATEDDVFTMCFQRDSNKDRIIVWCFILGTVGLLGWTGFKRFSVWREGRALGRQDIGYAPVSASR